MHVSMHWPTGAASDRAGPPERVHRVRLRNSRRTAMRRNGQEHRAEHREQVGEQVERRPVRPQLVGVGLVGTERRRLAAGFAKGFELASALCKTPFGRSPRPGGFA